MFDSIFKYMNQMVMPPKKASDVLITGPESARFGQRVSTPVWGTAPAMFGKGPPASLIETDDRLRPQTTKSFNKHYQGESHDFPDLHISKPIRVQAWNPISTRGAIVNF